MVLEIEGGCLSAAVFSLSVAKLLAAGQIGPQGKAMSSTTSHMTGTCLASRQEENVGK